MTRCVILIVLLASSALAQTPGAGLDPPDRVFEPGPPLTPPSARLLHPRPVRGAAWTPDGSRIVTVCGDGTVRVWDAGNGCLRASWVQAGAELDCVAVSPGGGSVATGSRDGRLQVREFESGKVAVDVQASETGLVSAAFVVGDGELATTDARGVLRIHDLREPTKAARIVADLGSPDATVRRIGDSRSILSASTARLWDLRDAAPAADLATIDPGSDADASPDGRSIVCVRPDFAIVRVPADGGESRDPVELQAGARPVRLRWTPDSGIVVALARDGSVWLCVPELGFRWKLASAEPGSRVLELSPDGQRILVLGSPAQLAVYERKTAARVLPPTGSDRAVTHLRFAQDGRALFLARADGDVEALDPRTGDRRRAWTAPDGRILALDPCADGRVLIATHGPAGIRVRDLTTGADLVRFPQSAVPDFACLAGDAGVFVCDTAEKRIRVWDLGSGTERQSVPYPVKWPRQDSRPADIVAAAISSDGTVLVGGFLTCLGQWDLRTGREVSISGPHEFDGTLALSPDGTLVAAGHSYEGLSASPSGRPGTRLKVSQYPTVPRVIALSSDPRRAACLKTDGTILEWNPVSGAMPRRFAADHAAILAFSPDASRLFAGLPDGSIRVWKLHDLPAPRRTRDSLPELWGALASARLDRSLGAAEELASCGEEAVAFLRERFGEAPRAASLARLVADFCANAGASRSEARSELEWLGVLAEPELRRALDRDLPAAVKAELAALLDLAESRLGPSPTNRQRRHALFALEISGLPSARQILQRLAADSPSPRERADAVAAARRLDMRLERRK